MSHVDRFNDERVKTELVLDVLESIAARLQGGTTVPTAELAEVVGSLRKSEEAAYDASQVSEGEPPLSACVAQHGAARVRIRKMQQAVESLERGEPAAVDAFVINAREYLRLCREHMQLGDQFFTNASRGMPSHPVLEHVCE